MGAHPPPHMPIAHTAPPTPGTAEPRRLELRLDARMDELARLSQHTQACWSGAPELLHLIDLCLEEVISNTLKYGLRGDSGHAIDVLVQQTAQELLIEIRDDAPFFDAFARAPAPDLDAPLEDRPIGGLGVHLVRSLMDEASVTRAGTVNVTRLVKHLASPDG